MIVGEYQDYFVQSILNSFPNSPLENIVILNIKKLRIYNVRIFNFE